MALGIDLTKISRFEKHVEDKNFYEKVFTEKEIDLINSKAGKRKLEIMAGRFSGKEAVSKAIGTGIGKVSLKDVEILNDEHGKPKVYLYGKSKQLWNKKFKNQPEISISHDGEYSISIITEKKEEKFLNINTEINSILKSRKRDSHKGNYGKVALVGGSKGMCGSIDLSSKSALRTGAGLVYTVVPEGIENIVEIKAVENIVWNVDYSKLASYENQFKKIDSFGIGPGMGSSYSYENIEFYLKNYDKNFVIDADGLNIIAENLNKLPREKNMVFTPHEMEMSRLTGIKVDDIHKNREEIAVDFAKKHGITLVLKGKNTVVTNGYEIYINKTGNPGMATAGSGDVLTGILATLIGQKYKIFEAVKLGVYIHGLSGDMALRDKGEDGIIARDIVENIPSAMKFMKENR